jgi:hypothetical protein
MCIESRYETELKPRFIFAVTGDKSQGEKPQLAILERTAANSAEYITRSTVDLPDGATEAEIRRLGNREKRGIYRARYGSPESTFE